MIARHFGHEVDLGSLKRRFQSSSRGITLGNLLGIAEQLMLDSRALRAEVEYLKHLATPALLHMVGGHFVVLVGVDAKGVLVNDPKSGKRRLSWVEVDAGFSGVAVEFSRAPNFQKAVDRDDISWRQIFGPTPSVRQGLALLICVTAALEIFSLIAPLSIQVVVDHALTPADSRLIWCALAGFSVVLGLQALAAVVRGTLVARMAVVLQTKWTQNVFAHLMRLPTHYFEKRSLADVASRFSSIQSVQQTVTQSFVESMFDGLASIFVLGALAVYSAKLALLSLATVCVYALSRRVFYTYQLAIKENQVIASAKQSAHLLESIRSAQAIKLGGMQSSRISKMIDLTEASARVDQHFLRASVNFVAFNRLLSGLSRLVLISMGVLVALGNDFTIGMLMVVVAYSDMFGSRVSALVDKVIDFSMLRLHLFRIADITREPIEQSLVSTYSGHLEWGTLEIRNVSFRYSPTDPWVVRNCSFKIAPGESVAISGPSGCGKSTLAKIITGLIPPTEGSISLNGVDITRIGLLKYRSYIGAVMQNDELFAGSLADNISLFDPGADLAAVVSAAQRAQIHEEIVSFPMGYETIVGDMGSSLSGGQRQRVLLARALYRAPSFLVLDEATSHLDSAREKQVNAEIRSARMSRLIIAHRTETLASADRVLSVSGGAIGDSNPLPSVAREISLVGAEI